MKEEIHNCPTCGTLCKVEIIGEKIKRYEPINEEESQTAECDVEGCENEPCCGGTCWKDTGYWSVCSTHSQDHRDGKPQPQMKAEVIEKEKTRDLITGYLPIKP